MVKRRIKDKSIPSLVQRIVIFGDSNAFYSFQNGGYGSKLAVHFSAVADILVRGVPGGTTRSCFDMIRYLPLPQKENELCCVIVAFGTNDSADKLESPKFHVPITEYSMYLHRIISYLKNEDRESHHQYQISPEKIIMMAPPSIDEEKTKSFSKTFGPALRNDLLAGYTKRCVDVSKDTGVKCVDLSKLIDASNAGSMTSDGVHYNRRGNAVVFNALIKAMDRVDPGERFYPVASSVVRQPKQHKEAKKGKMKLQLFNSNKPV